MINNNYCIISLPLEMSKIVHVLLKISNFLKKTIFTKNCSAYTTLLYSSDPQKP